MAMESVAKLSLPPPKSKANDDPLSLKSNKRGGGASKSGSFTTRFPSSCPS